MNRNKKTAKRTRSVKTKRATAKAVQSRRTGRIARIAIAIIALILNIIILPGLGSLIGGRIKTGIWQLVILFGGVLVGLLLTMTTAGEIIGAPLIFLGPIAAWIWGIITGIQLIQNS